jgi:hypothetical protein
VVKPKEVVSVFGKCHIKLSDEDMEAINNHDVEADTEASEIPAPVAVSNTMVEDSDDEEAKPEPKPVVVAKPEPVAEVAVVEPVKKVVKKIVKKA